MSTPPGAARVVVIGAGIVGNSLVYHLARLGWKDIVQIEKGPLPNPGGSTGHASNFIFLTDHSREMTALTADSVEQYKEMGVFTQSGGIEVARTPERMEELKRRMASSRSWGIESELVTPEEIKAMVPYVNTDIILGGFSTPGIGVVDSLRAGTIMRERAQALGCAPSVADDRGHRHRRRGRARDPGPDRQGRLRGGRRRHRRRRLEPADRGDGRRGDPAHARRSTR